MQKINKLRQDKIRVMGHNNSATCSCHDNIRRDKKLSKNYYKTKIAETIRKHCMIYGKGGASVQKCTRCGKQAQCARLHKAVTKIFLELLENISNETVGKKVKRSKRNRRAGDL